MLKLVAIGLAALAAAFVIVVGLQPAEHMSDVCRSAEAEALVVELDDRHRRFRRDAIDAADDEVIEHHVADDEDGAARQAGGHIRRRHESGGAGSAGARSAA